VPRADSIEDALARLQRLRDDPFAPASVAELRRALAGKSSHVAASAARIAGDCEIAVLVPDLVTAFERLLIDPVKADPTCAAKTAIADALYRMAAETETVFLRGVRHVQLEPVWGGKADTAGPLRVASAFGLARLNHPETRLVLADLLVDADPSVRAEAARVAAYTEDDRLVPVLRLKVRVGDERSEVVSECMAAMLVLDPSTSLPFVAGYLDAPGAEVREAAALALGQSRRPEALPLLRVWWERTSGRELRRTALLAIAMLKHDAAIAHLLSLVREGRGPDARDALAALGVYRHDEALVDRVRAAATRDDVDLTAAFDAAFPPNPRNL